MSALARSVSTPSQPKVALVLGAGGPVGHAYHAGVLTALRRASGWDPREADLIVGTSAGAQVAALLRAGMEPQDLKSRITGDTMTAGGQALAQHYHRPKKPELRAGTRRSFWPASTKYLLGAFRTFWQPQPGRFIAALLPAGRGCTLRQAEGLRKMFANGWPERPLWITAVQLDTGLRVAFGRPGDPQTDVGTAVTCSGAVPSVTAPVPVDGHLYVDGGMASPTNLDLLHGTDVDIVVVSSPLSRLAPVRMLFGREVKRLRRAGKQVFAFEPQGHTREAMGLNPLAFDRGPLVARFAYATTLHSLIHSPDHHQLLALLKASAPRLAATG